MYIYIYISTYGQWVLKTTRSGAFLRNGSHIFKTGPSEKYAYKSDRKILQEQYHY